mgnify:CR=1 FL=1
MAEKRVIELEIQDNSKSLKSQYKEAVQELQVPDQIPEGGDNTDTPLTLF